MKKRLLLALVLVIALVCGAFGALAYFSDTETSTGNSFTAGTLDLNIDGANTNVAKFNISNMKPGDQPTGTYTLKNVGSLPGYIDIHEVVVTDAENNITEPENEAGDVTAAGELSSLVNLRLYFDNDKDGYYSTGDVMFFNGKLNTMPASFELDKAIAAGQEIKVNAVLDWWSGASDNLGQSDSMTVGMKFELSQTAAQ